MSNSILHYTIIKFFIDNCYAPTVSELSNIMEVPEEEISKGLKSLQENHGVVLHPNSDKIWVIHPFSSAPTNFVVKSQGKEWWEIALGVRWELQLS